MRALPRQNIRMSKVKSPPEKKRNSLLKDRRNIYGECPTSSRKNISKGKKRSHKALRRAVAEELRPLKGASSDGDADVTEERARQKLVEHKRASFKKVPDAPLAVVLNRKVNKRVEQKEKDTVPVAYDQVLERWRSEERVLREIKRKQKSPHSFGAI